MKRGVTLCTSIWREDLEAKQKHDASFFQPPSVSCQSNPHKPKLTSYPSARIFSTAPNILLQIMAYKVVHVAPPDTSPQQDNSNQVKFPVIPLKTVGYLCTIAQTDFSVRNACFIPIIFLGGWWEQLGFPGGASGKELNCQCRRCERHGYNPWVRKIPWKRAQQPTSVFLSGECDGWRSLAAYGPQGHKELDWSDIACTHAHIKAAGKWSTYLPRLSLTSTKKTPHLKTHLSRKTDHFLVSLSLKRFMLGLKMEDDREGSCSAISRAFIPERKNSEFPQNSNILSIQIKGYSPLFPWGSFSDQTLPTLDGESPSHFSLHYLLWESTPLPLYKFMAPSNHPIILCLRKGRPLPQASKAEMAFTFTRQILFWTIKQVT